MAVLDARPTAVYVGFGSMLVPDDSAAVAIEAIRAQGRRASGRGRPTGALHRAVDGSRAGPPAPTRPARSAGRPRGATPAGIGQGRAMSVGWSAGRIRRRELLAASGLAAAVLLLGGRGGSAHAVAPAAPAGPGLSAQRAATVAALVAVLGASPDGRFSVGASGAVPVLDGWYAGQAETVRAHVDEVLDRLAADGIPAYDELARPVASVAGARRRAARHPRGRRRPRGPGLRRRPRRTRRRSRCRWSRGRDRPPAPDDRPGGRRVPVPGSSGDLRYHGNIDHLLEAGATWVRLWADWPTLQPDPGVAIDDPASRGTPWLAALDEQIATACAAGLRVVLTLYRFPLWANGLQDLGTRRDSDEEIAFFPEDRIDAGGLAPLKSERAAIRRSTTRRAAARFRIPPDGLGPDSPWGRFFGFLYARYHHGQRDSGRWVRGFELTNEPNHQWWPKWVRRPPPTRSPSASPACPSRTPRRWSPPRRSPAPRATPRGCSARRSRTRRSSRVT